MAFTVQDSTGLVAGANAYAAIAFCDTYLADRGKTAWDSLTDSQKQAAIIEATDYLDVNFKYGGLRLNDSGQVTEFPRRSLYDANAVLVSGIPERLQEACAELAYRASQGTELFPDLEFNASGRKVKDLLKVGPITIEEGLETGGSSAPRFPVVERILREFTLSSPGFGQIEPGRI